MRTFFQVIVIILLVSCKEDFYIEESQIPYTNEDIKRLYIQTKSEILKEFKILDKHGIKQYIQQNQNGKWNDINYKDDSMSIWEPYYHLHRTLLLAVAYNKYEEFKSSYLINIINNSLSDFRINQYISQNWWYNSIGSCSLIGKILILMNGYIDKENWAYFTNYLNKLTPIGHLGANKIDIATYHFYRGICTSNDSILKSNINIISEELNYKESDGFQVDGSYIHDNIRYISGYGETVIEGIIKMLSYTHNTNYHIPHEQFLILRTFLTQTYGNTLRGNYMDWNAIGRQISRPNYINKKNMEFLYEKILEIDKDNSSFYNNIISNFNNQYPTNPIYTKFYYNSDYLLHCNEKFNISVGGTSTRIAKPERANGENLLGTLLSLGSTSIRITGDEYYNIFPLWNWSMIPGVTSTDVIPIFEKDGSVKGKSEFSGGLSIEKENHGIYSFILKEYNLGGKKSYFCIPEGLVCLGYDLKGSHKLHTTIDQTFFSNENFILNPNYKEIFHNFINYISLDNNNFQVDISEKKGNWNIISKEQNDSLFSSKIISISIQHNNNEQYAYAILPNIQIEKAQELVKTYTIINDSKKQGLFNNISKFVYVTFYEADIFENEHFSIKVDKPSCIIIDLNEKKMYISDPTHKEKEIKITFNNNEYTILFPKGNYIGSSVCCNLS